MTDAGTFVVIMTAGALFVAGLSCLMIKCHLIKMVMGLEFCGKGASLLLILGGYLAGDTGVSQAVVITLIAIEAVIAGVALALVILLKKKFQTFDSAAIFRLISGGGS
ncbi:MAG: putative monovalent cation/H+ antiporter subunit C [Methanoregula sp. PtaU1.Bin051]|nr:MAG: putative monovalent cation/H+ antiporter subunit C [Methanoregula sp. PtaU1.Bin051]